MNSKTKKILLFHDFFNLDPLGVIKENKSFAPKSSSLLETMNTIAASPHLSQEEKESKIREALKIVFATDETGKETPEYKKEPKKFERYFDISVKWFLATVEEKEKQMEIAHKRVILAMNEVMEILPKYRKILLTLNPKIYPELSSLTAAVGLKKSGGTPYMVFFPTLVLYCNLKQLIFVLIHELFHILFDHFRSKGERELRKYNIAADYEINQIIAKDLSLIEFPDGPLKGLLDDEYEGMNAHQIYDILLLKEKEKEGDNESEFNIGDTVITSEGIGIITNITPDGEYEVELTK